MDIIKDKLQIHKQTIKNLTEDLIKTKNLQEEIIIKDKIKMEQEFLDSLYNILNTYVKNSDEKTINIKNEMINKNEKIENSESENKTIKKNNKSIKDNTSKNTVKNKTKPKKKLSKSCNKNSKKFYLNIEIEDPENAKNFNYYFKDNDINAKYYLKLKKTILIIMNVAKNKKGVKVKLDTTKMKKNLY